MRHSLPLLQQLCFARVTLNSRGVNYDPLSQVGIVSKWLNRSNWFLVWRLVTKKIGYLKMRVFFAGIFLDLENFATARRSLCCQLSLTKMDDQCNKPDRPSNFVDNTCDGRRPVYHTERQSRRRRVTGPSVTF